MPVNSLRKDGDSYVVTVDKGDVKADGFDELIEDGVEVPARVVRDGYGQFRIEVLDERLPRRQDHPAD